MPNPSSDLDARVVATVRGLSMDAPHAARSGHQGTAMALAPLTHVLYTRILRFDASDPHWPDRDRLILSPGHASILLYSYLYLTGHGLELDDLRDFRQWGSEAPGHPEAGHTAGVEVTTGPLGQGFGNAVGMAMAERFLRARLGADLCDHRTFVICSDGDLMEGVSHEAASFAGHQQLGRLIAIYDDNGITIDGRTDLTFSDDTAARFESYGWHVLRVGEIGEDFEAIEAAIREAMASDDRPSMIVLKTKVGIPATEHTDDHAAHGYAIVDAEIAATKTVMGLPPDESFHVADDVLAAMRDAGARGQNDRRAWDDRVDALDADSRGVLDSVLSGVPLAGWTEALPKGEPGASPATRVSSQNVLRALMPYLPGLVVGSADLTGNVGLTLADSTAQSNVAPGAQQVYYGIREHGMAAAAVGMARHGGVTPVIGTFFVFSDYMKPAIRLAAMSGARVIFVFTHDSIGVGEDGPTHQPIEQLAALRSIPGLAVFRPADADEVAHCWAAALDYDGPSALILTRQGVPNLEASRGEDGADGIARGAYVVVEPGPGEAVDLVLVATGSEVSIAIDAAQQLEDDGISVQVVSMPCWELFAGQDDDYQEDVMPSGAPALSIEAASTFGWERWADDSVGIDHFGASAPAGELFERFGFNVANVVRRSRELLDAVYGDDEDDDDEDE